MESSVSTETTPLEWMARDFICHLAKPSDSIQEVPCVLPPLWTESQCGPTSTICQHSYLEP